MLIEEIESFLEVHYKSPTVDFFFKNIEYLSTKSNYSAEVLYINPRNLFFFQRYTIYQSKKSNYFQRHVIVIQETELFFRGTLY